jgi:hypothetical protein
VPNLDHQQPEPNISSVTSDEILCDPALRYEYALEIQDQVRRAYILMRPTQRTNLIFPCKQYAIGD